MNKREELFIAVQDSSGDSKLKLSWDKNDQDAKELAKDTFLRLKKNGYRIYSVKKILKFIEIKGNEMDEFAGEEGGFYYQKDKTSEGNRKNSFTVEDVEADNVKYEDPKKFDPEKDDIDTDKSYVATKGLYAG